MNQKELMKKIAKLETINDQLTAEMLHLDRLTRSLGFVDGIKTLKAAALEMIEADQKRKKKGFSVKKEEQELE